MNSNHTGHSARKNIFLTGASSSGKTTVIKKIISRDNTIIILDGTGKRECYSEQFRLLTVRALDSPHIVVGTASLGGDDIEIIEGTASNRNALPDVILGKIKALREGVRP